MHLSRTWQTRVQRVRSQARRAGMALLILAAVFGAAAGCKVFLTPDRPDFVGIAQRERNQQSLVGAFASDFVVAWRTAKELSWVPLATSGLTIVGLVAFLAMFQAAMS